jgi:hypothetical protein
MHKFDYTHVDLAMIMEMICKYRVIEEATKLRGKEVNLTIEGITKVFKPPSIGMVT